MSKKSRRRNKRLLMLAALAGGAALAGRGRGIAQGVSGADKAKFTSDAAYSPAPVTGVAEKVAPADTVDTGGSYKFKPRVHPGTILNQRRATPGYGVKGPPGILNPYNPRTHVGRGNFNYKKGGRVTGIAKRGFGRALMKGKK